MIKAYNLFFIDDYEGNIFLGTFSSMENLEKCIENIREKFEHSRFIDFEIIESIIDDYENAEDILKENGYSDKDNP